MPLLPFNHVLLDPGETVHAVYFPGDGVYSITQVMTSGRSVEVATVGNEGFLGINALLGGRPMSCGALVKIPDRAALAMSVSIFDVK
jgi:CRP-like cAMP-binding protein